MNITKKINRSVFADELNDGDYFATMNYDYEGTVISTEDCEDSRFTLLEFRGSRKNGSSTIRISKSARVYLLETVTREF